ncbi:MAG: dTDP-4-dehydrorhamnose 3,5-epimerase family protein [Pseudomonadota bacterium]
MADDTPPQDLLTLTLPAAQKDAVTVSASGEEKRMLPDGASLVPANVLTDARGSLFEMGRNSRTPDAPLKDIFGFTLRPGVVKGWGLHKRHDDRYFLVYGDMEVFLFDVRSDSSTYGQLFRVTLSEKSRMTLTIPRYVWHADHNVGVKDAFVVNMPTEEYDHANPDKYRLPINTDLIPHDFGDATGG